MDFIPEAIAFKPPIPHEKIQQFPSMESAEQSVDQIRNHALTIAIEAAITEVKHKFNNPDKPEKNKPYHNEVHIDQGIARGKLALAAMEADDSDQQMFEYAFTFHDIEQVRPKVSEHLSAKRAVRYLSAINHAYNANIFSIPEMRNVYNAIIMTIPAYSAELRTIQQPNLQFAQSKTEVAVAFADLAGLGLDNSEVTALDDAKNLFLELHGDQPKNEQTEQQYIDSVSNWFINSQPNFVAGRKEAYKREINSLPPKFDQYKIALHSLCNEDNFDKAATIVRIKAELVSHTIKQSESLPQDQRLKAVLEIAMINDPNTIKHQYQLLNNKTDD